MKVLRRVPLRAKLTFATLFPLLIAISICSITGFFILVVRIKSQVQEKVRNDLNTAWEIYENEIGHVRDVVRFTAGAPYVAEALAGQRRAELAEVLTPLMGSEQLHIFTAVDVAGHVVFRAQNPLHHEDDRSDDLFVRKALAGEIVAGTAVFPSQRIILEGEELARQAVVRIIPTPRAQPSRLAEEDSALVLVASAPVRDRTGQVVGALYGGVMLNNNNGLVDRIKKVVYEEVKFDGKDLGRATIFLNGTRIATNVTGTDGKRAIGTRLSEEVYNRIALRKEKYVGRAFVVNDWYFSAYEPILSLEGEQVGALYVGMLERPYSQLKGRLSLLMVGVLMVGGGTGVVAARLATARLARSMKELESLASRVAAGERGITIDVATEEEIGDLATRLNQMSTALARQEEEIRDFNQSLERKIVERTVELKEKNRLLLDTQKELLRVEKLAAIGELAAGVAHEINNPMAIIRGNADLIQLRLSPDSPANEEVGIIMKQVARVERIVSGLLRFAREKEKEIGKGDINFILDDILAQLGHHIPLHRIVVEKYYDPAGAEVQGDPEQLRQVFTNLVLNAVQAMPEGGALTVSTGIDHTAGMATVMVGDTGCGISPENLERVFNPFFTTKAGGTGLGLAVSYGIVRSHGGEITVQSTEGKGTRFTVRVPIHAGAKRQDLWSSGHRS